MKLIEKLAWDAGNKWTRHFDPDNDTEDSCYFGGFEEGFRKALELAANVCDQGDGSMSSMHEHILGNGFRDQIRKLGEEEV